MRAKLRRHRRLLLTIAFLAMLLAVLKITGLSAQFELAPLRATLQMHPVGGLLLFMVLFAGGNLLQIPGWVFLAAAVLTLGEVVGGLVTYLAAAVSCLSTFGVIRWIGGDALRRFDHPWGRRILARLDQAPVRSVFLLRLLFQTMPALNYTLALSGVSVRGYVVGTLLGLPLPIAIYCLFFESLRGLLGLG